MSRSARPLALALGLGALLLPAIASAQALVVCSEASPDFLNPQFSSQNTAYDVAAQIYERLTATQRGGSQIIPSLAESWTISEDALSYTFKLRKGVKWHASKSFTPTREFNADDVLFSFNRMLDANHPYNKVGSGNYQFFGEIVKPSLKAVEKVDDYTVRIVLTKPNAPLLSALSVEPMSILSAEYAAAMSKAGTPEQIDFAPIGTGPFSLLSYQKDAVIRFKAVPDHWTKAAGDRDRMALVNDLIFVITPDAAVRFAKVRSGECQIARYPNPGDLAAMKTEPTINVLQGSIADQSFLAFNQQKKPFGDKRVREALAYAVNIPAIIDAVYQGTGKPTASAVPPSLWSHDADLKPRPYDPEKAKALLKEAGYPDGFETTLWAIPVVRAYMPNGRRAAELIQARLGQDRRQGDDPDLRMGRIPQARPRRRARGRHVRLHLGLSRSEPDPAHRLDLRRRGDRRQPGTLVQQGGLGRAGEGQHDHRPGRTQQALQALPGALPRRCRRPALRQRPGFHAGAQGGEGLQDPLLRRAALLRRLDQQVSFCAK